MSAPKQKKIGCVGHDCDECQARLSESPSKQVIVFPRGQLTAEDKASLQENGFLVVEADDPKAVVTHLPSAPLVTSNEMLIAALGAMCGDNGSHAVRSAFTVRLTRAIDTKEPK